MSGTDRSIAFRNAKLFDPEKGFLNGHVIVRGGAIEAVEPLDWNGDADVDIDASQFTLLPGLIDAHAHPRLAGQEASGLSLRKYTSVGQVQSAVADYANSHPEEEWIIGEGLDLAIRDDGVFFASDLDSVVSDRPVALRSTDVHTFWCNSMALKRSGFTRDVPDPPDGIVDRDDDGAPIGTLREWGAFTPLLLSMPKTTLERRAGYLLSGLRQLLACGVTSVTDAWVDASDVPAYVLAAEQGLPVKLHMALRADPARWREQVSEFIAITHRINELPSGTGLTTGTVKLFADGIIENFTAAVHEPYSGTSCCGLPNWPFEELNSAVKAFDAAGFDVHIHAIGDRAVTAALDAIEQSTLHNPPRDRRHAIAHAQLVADADLHRLAALDVTAVLQPFWAKLDPVMLRLTFDRLGVERQDRQYPFKTLLEHGVRVAFSSDFPVSSPHPLHGAAIAMSRNDTGEVEDPWVARELLTLSEALCGYTIASAHVTHTGHNGGRIASGRPADLSLFHGDLEAMTPRELLEAEAVSVWVDGREVLGSLDPSSAESAPTGRNARP